MRSRTGLRWIHGLGALSVGTLVYSPLIDEPVFLLFSQWIVIPVLSVTGIWMWKGETIRRRLLSRFRREGNHKPGRSWSLAEKITLATGVVALLHHTDHVLRVDHSGWPFTDNVNMFTYSLLVYPAMLILFLARGFPRTRVVLAVLLFLFPTLAHTFIETPLHQYKTWQMPMVNMLQIQSEFAGVIAALITVSLSALTFAIVLAYRKEVH